jgi:predicted metal-dependent hydrolase
MNTDIQFIHTKRAKRLSIVISPEGVVKVTMPLGFSRGRAEAFVEMKRKWIVGALARIHKRNEKYKDAVRLPKSNAEDLEKYKKAALELANARLEYFNTTFYGGRFTWKRVTIRNTKTRWGSCSQRGNVSFNYRIVLLPEVLADYLVVHELCHIGEMNHSKRFWDLVAVAIPEWKKMSKELRRVRSV